MNGTGGNPFVRVVEAASPVHSAIMPVLEWSEFPDEANAVLSWQPPEIAGPEDTPLGLWGTSWPGEPSIDAGWWSPSYHPRWTGLGPPELDRAGLRAMIEDTYGPSAVLLGPLTGQAIGILDHAGGTGRVLRWYAIPAYALWLPPENLWS